MSTSPYLSILHCEQSIFVLKALQNGLYTLSKRMVNSYVLHTPSVREEERHSAFFLSMKYDVDAYASHRYAALVHLNKLLYMAPAPDLINFAGRMMGGSVTPAKLSEILPTPR